MRRLQTDMPLGSERSSGSAVRFPVITTLLMFVAATTLSFQLVARSLRRHAAFSPSAPTESRAACGRNSQRPSASLRSLRGSLGPRGGAEHLVPVRRADAEAAGVVLEVVAHVAFAQDPPDRPTRAEVVQVIVGHVVDQVAREEPGSESG